MNQLPQEFSVPQQLLLQPSVCLAKLHQGTAVSRLRHGAQGSGGCGLPPARSSSLLPVSQGRAAQIPPAEGTVILGTRRQSVTHGATLQRERTQGDSGAAASQ